MLRKAKPFSTLFFPQNSAGPSAIPALSTFFRAFTTPSGGNGNEADNTWGEAIESGASNDLGWDDEFSWSTGLTKEHFDGQAVGRQTNSSEARGTQSQLQKVDSDELGDLMKEWVAENKKSKAYVDGWRDRMRETSVLMKQVREPGLRGSYLKDSEKAEMYRLHKENPEVYTVEKLAKDYRIMRQRVHAILWLKEIEEEEEKKLGHPLDDSIELLLDMYPE